MNYVHHLQNERFLPICIAEAVALSLVPPDSTITCQASPGGHKYAVSSPMFARYVQWTLSMSQVVSSPMFARCVQRTLSLSQVVSSPLFARYVQWTLSMSLVRHVCQMDIVHVPCLPGMSMYIVNAPSSHDRQVYSMDIVHVPSSRVCPKFPWT